MIAVTAVVLGLCFAVAESVGTLQTLAGAYPNSGYNGDNIAATSAQLNFPAALWVDSADSVYISDTANCRIRKVSSTGIITTLAGDCAGTSTNDGDPAASFAFSYPQGLTADPWGNVYCSDINLQRVFKITNDTTPVVKFVAGTGVAGFTDNIAATSAQLNYPYDTSLDVAGRRLFIADYGNSRVRKVQGGIISTVAHAATGFGPMSLAADFSAAALFIGDLTSGFIRLLDLTSNTMSVIAGGSTSDCGGGSVDDIRLPSIYDIVLDKNDGALYITDIACLKVFKMKDYVFSPVVGAGSGGRSPDGTDPLSVQFQFNSRLGINSHSLYIADGTNNEVRSVALVDPTASPTIMPSEAPTEVPSAAPTEVPSLAPTAVPSQTPTAQPSATPTRSPTRSPTRTPTVAPTTAGGSSMANKSDDSTMNDSEIALTVVLVIVFGLAILAGLYVFMFMGPYRNTQDRPDASNRGFEMVNNQEKVDEDANKVSAVSAANSV